jgi:hypothetical protein
MSRGYVREDQESTGLYSLYYLKTAGCSVSVHRHNS